MALFGFSFGIGIEQLDEGLLSLRSTLRATLARRLCRSAPFVNPQIVAAEQLRPHRFIKDPEHHAAALHPVTHHVAIDVDLVLAFEDLLLPVKGRVIEVFGDDLRGGRTGSPAAAIAPGMARYSAGISAVMTGASAGIFTARTARRMMSRSK